MIVTVTEVRRAGHCVRGAREWFEAHGLDFAKFLSQGIDEDEFLATGDALAQQVVEHMHNG